MIEGFKNMTLNDEDFELPSTADIAYYQTFREAGRELNNELIKELPKSAYKECGKKLGIWQGNTLIFGREEEADVFFDFCLHQFRINKTNVIERHLALNPPPSDSIELAILQSLCQSHYSVFVIKEVFKNKGVIALDLLYAKEFFIIDIGLSVSGVEGLIFATHIRPFLNKFHVSSGATLPVPPVFAKDDKLASIIIKFIPENSGDLLSKNKEALFASQVIRTVLKAYAQDESRGWGYLE